MGPIETSRATPNPVRVIVLTIALVFIAGLAVLTGIDIASYGVTAHRSSPISGPPALYDWDRRGLATTSAGMSERLGVLQEGRARRATREAQARRARRRRARCGFSVLAAGVARWACSCSWLRRLRPDDADRTSRRRPHEHEPGVERRPSPSPRRAGNDYGVDAGHGPGSARASSSALRSGMLFDVRTGQGALGSRPRASRPDREPDEDDDRARRRRTRSPERARADHAAPRLDFTGSGVGLLADCTSRSRSRRCSTACCCPRGTTPRSRSPSTSPAPRRASSR